MASLLTAQLVSPDHKTLVDTASALAGKKVIGLYFSAHCMFFFAPALM